MPLYDMVDIIRAKPLMTRQISPFRRCKLDDFKGQLVQIGFVLEHGTVQ